MERDEQENALCEGRIHLGIYPGDPLGANHFQAQALGWLRDAPPIALKDFLAVAERFR
jgi:hypothetical protein